MLISPTVKIKNGCTVIFLKANVRKSLFVVYPLEKGDTSNHYIPKQILNTTSKPKVLHYCLKYTTKL